MTIILTLYQLQLGMMAIGFRGLKCQRLHNYMSSLFCLCRAKPIFTNMQGDFVGRRQQVSMQLYQGRILAPHSLETVKQCLNSFSSPVGFLKPKIMLHMDVNGRGLPRMSNMMLHKCIYVLCLARSFDLVASAFCKIA